MEMYLRRQGKWRVFPLACFYTLSLFMIVIRSLLVIFTVNAAENFDIFAIMMPALLKILIGIVQIEVMVELILRVEEGTKTQTEYLSSKDSIVSGSILQQDFVVNIVASRKRVDCWVLTLRIFTAVVVCVGIIVSSTLFIYKDAHLDKFNRADYVDGCATQFSYQFFGLSVFLFATIVMLWYSLQKRTTMAIKLPASFKRETSILLWINICFCSTYLLRGLSETYVVPLFFDSREFIECELLGNKNVCVPFNILVYYTWTNMLWDWFP